MKLLLPFLLPQEIKAVLDECKTKCKLRTLPVYELDGKVTINISERQIEDL